MCSAIWLGLGLGMALVRVRVRVGDKVSGTVRLNSRRGAPARCSPAGAVQALCNCSPMSAAQDTTSTPQTLLVGSTRRLPWPSVAGSTGVHRPWVCRLPSAARASTPPFNVRSSGLFCGWSDGLELVTRLSSRSDTFFWQFSWRPENVSFLSRYTAH